MLLNLVIMLSMVADSNGKYECLFVGTTVFHIVCPLHKSCAKQTLN